MMRCEKYYELCTYIYIMLGGICGLYAPKFSKIFVADIYKICKSQQRCVTIYALLFSEMPFKLLPKTLF